ncbi:MAG: cyclopropane-fatty-acyl-phospholipid synthase family protein, partial [Pseudomonadota bacterium]
RHNQNIFWGGIKKLMRLMWQRNTISSSKKNILAHYDLGNSFYQLWLDETMTYSSALFQYPQQSLAAAQHNKYNRIISELGRKSGKILEIGCGWGGFSRQATASGDFQSLGVTISDEQYNFCQQQQLVQVKFVNRDYRLLDGKYDHIVSIEMFEAVGKEYWQTYFNKVKALLTKKGRAVIQTISIREDLFDNYNNGTDFIRRHIFPGGFLPTIKHFKHHAEAAGLKLVNQFSFGQDYATTLLEWLQNFERCQHEVRRLGFGEDFIRLWRCYLAGCAAVFAANRTNVTQLTLAHK